MTVGVAVGVAVGVTVGVGVISVPLISTLSKFQISAAALF